MSKIVPLSENVSLAQALNQALAALGAVVASLSGSPAGAPAERVTVGEACREFLYAKARAGRSDRYLRALRVSLGSFALGRYQQPLGEVTISELETWLERKGWKPRTKAGYLSDVRTLYNFCLRRGLVNHNPAAGVELPVCESARPVIHSPEQVAAVLEFARVYDLNLCRCLAVRYFAGLRSSEADRLQESEIKAGHVEVTARNAKTRRRRLVTVQPALSAWVALGGNLSFGDRGNRWRWFVQALERKAGIPWAHNVTRHSFVSYHLAEFRNAALTALEAGHTEQMLFGCYRELVTPAQSAAFWGLRPIGS